MVPKKGLEPLRSRERQILSLIFTLEFENFSCYVLVIRILTGYITP